MSDRSLKPPVRVGECIVTTIDEAAYELRQYAVASGDKQAWRLAHALRDAENDFLLQSLEGRLRAWCLINNAHQLH